MSEPSPSRSKIGAMPWPVREQVHHRLLDGQVDNEILPWLNALPEVQKRLAARFGGKAISAQNLSDWRNGPHQVWKDERKEIEATQALSEFAQGLAEAAGGRMSAGAKALATGRIMARLSQMGEDTDLESLLDTVKAVKDLSKADVDAEKVDLDKVKTNQAERQLVLQEDKFKRETAGLFIAWAQDQKALEIANSGAAKEIKMDQLILHIWGERPSSPIS